ncbi:MAG TPA: AmmeMemoRadiSam system protein B [Sedimentisphaerales bacterium]|nr:AmmeMemoRadiSam system protein B [Sedimentisphaerales bacterium]
MQVRNPIVAGQFYPQKYNVCIGEIEDCIQEKTLPAELPTPIVAGIVPHAGWIFSGSLAAMVFSAIKKQNEKVDSFIIFGAAHSYYKDISAVCDEGIWNSPIGQIEIDEELAKEVLKNQNAVGDSNAHKYEHSIEVQIPFIQHLFPFAKIVPILTPPEASAIELGKHIGNIIAMSDKKVVCIGSTDLTHYGPRYGFEPIGEGTEALRWSSQINDKEFIDCALRLDGKAMLDTAEKNFNACGAGAAAATVEAAKKQHRTQGLLLAQTTSSEVMKKKMNENSEDSVGYAAIVF